MDDDERAERMVREQIVSRGVRDSRVLDAMRRVPRHRFVGPAERAHAYDDRPLPIGEGQTISQPYMVAAMTEALGVDAGHRVLEIGTGSGYQAAILASLATLVISIERHGVLAKWAGLVLADLGVANVRIRVGDGTMGAADEGPFDRILVTAGGPAVPVALRRQLAVGGRLIMPVGPPAVQHLLIVDRECTSYRERLGEACVFVPLVGVDGWCAEPI